MNEVNLDAEKLARGMLDEAMRRKQPIVLSPPLAAFAREQGYVEWTHFVESKDIPTEWPERAGLQRGVIDGMRFLK